MAFLSGAPNELVTPAAPPAGGEAVALAAVRPTPLATPAAVGPVLRAIQGAIDEARGSGTRLAVCLADLSACATVKTVEERRVRPGDGLYRVGDELIVVAVGVGHPQNAERLAGRLQAMLTAEGDPPGVGLAVFPAHGDDAATLLDRARASAHRVGLLRRASDVASLDDDLAGQAT